MNTKRRSNLAAGLALILIGGAFLAAQLFPDMFRWLDLKENWPLVVIGLGLLLLFIGLISGVPAMAVPATIIGGIGGLLYWQNATEMWDTWSYVWTLIPGFVGVGIILAGLLGGRPKQAFREGGRTILVSLVLFAIFGAFLGGGLFSGYLWPILLIGVGALVLFGNVFRSR